MNANTTRLITKLLDAIQTTPHVALLVGMLGMAGIFAIMFIVYLRSGNH